MPKDMVAANDEVQSDSDVPQTAFIPNVIYTKPTEATITMDDIRPSDLSLLQAGSEIVQNEQAKAGQFLLPGFAPMDTVTLIPMATQKIRQYRREKDNMKAPPDCKSPNGIQGYGDPGILCAECPLSKWGVKDPKTGKASPPPCKEGISVLAYSIEHEAILNYVFRNQAMNAGKFITTQSITRGYGNFAVKVDKKRQSNDRGQNWYVPVIELIPTVPEEHIEKAAKLFTLVSAALEKSNQQLAMLDSGAVPE